MTYAIIATGIVGVTVARFFAAKDIPVLIANSHGPETLAKVAAEIGPSVTPAAVAQAVEADVVLVAVGSVAFKDVGAVLEDWSSKIVIDVTNGFMLPPEVQQAEYHGRLTSEVNAERVPLPLGLLAEEKASVSGLAAVMREAQEVEHLRSSPALAPAGSFLGNVEPSVEQLLCDEIAGLLRARDGLKLADVLRIVESAKESLRLAARINLMG
jgi:hypothetical protein